MSENTFYQWPGCTNCESLFPRAVLIRRIFNLARLDLKINNVYLPKPGPEFDAQLENRMLSIPYLEMNGEKLRSSRQIWDHVISHMKDSTTKVQLTKTSTIYSFILQQWCNESFINSLVHARWKKENNYQKFIASVDFGPHATPESVAVLRKNVLKYLSRTPIGDISQDDFQKLLVQQFSSLASMIEDKPFFEDFATRPSFTDLNVFMIVQGFLSPDIEESEWISGTYPALSRWYRNMERVTAKNATPDLLG